MGTHLAQRVPGFGDWYWRWKALRDGIHRQDEAESEQESEPYGGDHSTAIDHSVGNRRRRVGFLLGFGLSPPLALAVSKTQNISRLWVHTCLGTSSLRLLSVLV